MEYEHLTEFVSAGTTPTAPQKDRKSRTVVRMSHPRYHIIAVSPATTAEQIKPFVMNVEPLIRF